MKDKSVLKFDMLGGGQAILADMGGEDLWALRLGGALVTLGRRAEWMLSVDPVPHAWRICIQLNESDPRTIWFDVVEADAMKIEQYAGAN